MINNDKEQVKFNEKLRSNILINYVTKFISMAITFINIRVLISYLGPENYGWWTTLLSIISWISIGDFGIGNGLRNKLTESLAKEDYGTSKSYVSTAYYYLSIIGLIIVIVGMILLTITLNNRGISGEKIIVIVIMLIGTGVNFVLNIIGTTLYANNESGSVALISFIWNLMYFSSIVTLNIFKVTNISLVFVAISYIVTLTMANLIATIKFYYSNKFLRPEKRCINHKLAKDLTNLGGRFFILQIAGIVLFSTDNLIISRLINYESVTYYDLITKVFNNLNGFYSILLVPIWSATTYAFTRNDYYWIKKTAHKLHLLLIPFSVGIVIISIFFNRIINLWLGDSSINYEANTIIIFAVYSINAAWLGIYCSFLNGLGKINIQMYLAILGAILNVPLSIIFAKYLKMGVVGVKLATLSTQILQSIVLPIQYYKIISKEERGICENESTSYYNQCK